MSHPYEFLIEGRGQGYYGPENDLYFNTINAKTHTRMASIKC